MASLALSIKNQKWLINPLADALVFLAAPLFIVPLLFVLPLIFSWAAIKIAVLSISATGHHLPGFIRAYTDRNIFQKFRARLIIVPVLFAAMAIAAAWYRLSYVLFVLVIWGAWHGGMQTLGFLRIYDLKNGLQSKVMAKLDFWITLTWLIQVILWSVPKKTSILSYYYLAGGPLLPVHGVALFETFWLALTALATVAWLVFILYQAIVHRYLNLPKIICLAASMGFWAYCMITVNNILIGVILWEIFHDLQYNVFVWGYNHNRVRNRFSQSGLEKFLFQWDAKRIGLYALCIAAYGCIGILNQDIFHVYDNQPVFASALSQIGNVFAASALCHFYMDGFIWKVRDAKVRRDLGIGQSSAFTGHSEIRHWVGIGALVALCAYLGISEYRHRAQPGYAAGNNLAELVPASGYANYMQAEKLRENGEAAAAIVYLQKAIALDTAYGFARGELGGMKFAAGDFAGAIADLESLPAADRDENILDLLSQAYFQRAFQLLNAKDAAAAKPYLQKTLALNPQQAPAWNYLGMAEHVAGHAQAAREDYLKALELDSGYAMAKENLRLWESEYAKPN